MNKVYVFLLHTQKDRFCVFTLGQGGNQDPYALDCTIWEGKKANIHLGQKNVATNLSPTEPPEFFKVQKKSKFLKQSLFSTLCLEVSC